MPTAALKKTKPPSALERYNAKRDFKRTAEPPGKAARARKRGLVYVIQQHDATRMHFDFRLELDGVLKSWAVPKGPSLSTREKRLAVQTEDHPMSYRDFEGNIPEGEYGGGPVIVWDQGSWTPIDDPHRGMEKGHLRFSLQGEKLQGEFSLVRLRDKEPGPKSNWLLFKHTDEFAREGAEAEITQRLTQSVISGRTVQEVGPSQHRHAATAATGKAAAKKVTAKKAVAKKATSKKAAADKTAPRRKPASALPSLMEIEPQLATLVESAPSDERYVYEIKLDGYRLLASVDDGKVQIRSRNQIDWTDKFPAIATALSKLGAGQAIVDGELCAVTAEGKTDFQTLQNTMGRGRRINVDDTGLVFYLFDLLFHDGEDLRPLPLGERKARLEKLLKPNRSPLLRYSEHLTGDARTIFTQACHIGLEGVIGKRADAPYREGRSADWIKLKCNKRQEFVIAGYTESDARSGFRSLILAVKDAKGRLRYSGKVGTGFNAASHTALSKRLEKLRIDDVAIEGAPTMRDAVWVKPELVCEVTYAEITRDGSLRHASFEGLREDKPAEDVKLEKAVKAEAVPSAPPRKPGRAAAASGSRSNGKEDEVGGVRISHPERVMDAASGLTKLQLARYHESVSELLLPHALDRPLALVRCPQGDAQQCFFQKHVTPGIGAGVKRLKVEGQEALCVTDARGIYELVQFNAVELHGWGSRMPKPDKPDWLVFDLDPDTELDFEHVIDAAFEVREALSMLDLPSFVKTTGGKGLHVVVPLVPKAGWDEVKGFCKQIAETLAQLHPDRYVANMSKAKRSGKIFIDYLRNGRGATAVLPYSPRARPGATVSVPLDWKEVRKRHPKDFNVLNAPQWLSKRKDPWAGLREAAVALPKLKTGK